MSPKPIHAVQSVHTNAELIKVVAGLHFKPVDRVYDCTYGTGKWWRKYKPRYFYHSDLDDQNDPIDFREMPWDDEQFDVTCFDPPYVSIGGRKTTTLPSFIKAYGMQTSKLTVKDNEFLIYQGMAECHRVTRVGGLVVVKCMNYISGGKFVQGHDFVTRFCAGEMMGMEQVGEFIHWSGLGPQPKHNLDGSVRRQVHARNSHSFLCLFKKK